MATEVLTSDRFPAGATVSAFPRSNWPGATQNPAGDPVGAATTTGVVQANGSVTFTGLADGTAYWAHTDVSGNDRYVAFSTPAAAGSSNDVDVVSLPATPAGTNSIGQVGHNVTGISDGRKVVTTAGTRVTLAASTAAKYVVITAETDNTGLIVVGGTTVVASLSTRQGTPLNPGDTLTLEVDNLNDVNLDSTVSGDGVTFTYLT